MKLKDCYRGFDLFELYRFIVSECEDVNAYGVLLFLADNDYEIRKYQVEEEDVPGVMVPAYEMGRMDVSDMSMKRKK